MGYTNSQRAILSVQVTFLSGCINQGIPPPSAGSMYFFPGDVVYYTRSTGDCVQAVVVGASSLGSDLVKWAWATSGDSQRKTSWPTQNGTIQVQLKSCAFCSMQMSMESALRNESSQRFRNLRDPSSGEKNKRMRCRKRLMLVGAM